MPDVAAAPRRSRWVAVTAGVGALVLVAAGGIVSRMSNESRLTTLAAESAIPTVRIIRPETGTGAGELVLPADLRALNSAPIYARTSGYVQRWLVNIGETVRRGQVLAVLDAPEVEQQLAAARADLETAQANRRLAATTSNRWDQMLAKDAVSRQEADERRGELAARTAVAAAAAANVRRLETMIGFTRLRAPFDGVVISRNAEIGALVTAGSASAQPLFTIADVKQIRALVRVPQAFSAQVTPGMPVTLGLPEYPDRRFTATTTRSAGAVDPTSGTVLVELQAANGDRALKPGAYARATFPIRNAPGGVMVPPGALIFRPEGAQVAVLDANGRARLRDVAIGRDLGKSVEITSGLTVRDRVIDSPPDSLANGDQVRIAAADGDAAR